MSRLTGRCMNTSSRGGNLKQYAYMSMRYVLCLTVQEAVVHRRLLKMPCEFLMDSQGIMYTK